MKRIAIIDDELSARQSLRTLINSFCPDVEICGEAEGVESGYRLLLHCQPHCILLDISMEDGSGFELLDKFTNPSFQIIFTTAHDEFALKAFRYHALDYLLKPINPVELVKAIERIMLETPGDYPTRVISLLDSIRSGQFEKIAITSLEGMVFLRLDQIVRLESDASYTTFHLLNKERHLVARPMKEFEVLLPKGNFFKLHQSHVINLAFVKKMLREDGGYALMEDGTKVPIARRRKDDFLECIRQRFRM